VIGLTCGLFAVVARAERGPAMAGGEAVATRPLQLGFRENAGEARPSRALGSSSGGYGRALGRGLVTGASEGASLLAALMAGSGG
jgi:hypothetical protein